MLDTIILQMNEGQYHITNYASFGTTEGKVINETAPFKKWYNNPTSQDKKEEVYMPRLTLIKRGRPLFLKVEFSAPKLLYNNNLDELAERDFDEVVKILRRMMQKMGVLVWTRTLEKASVLSFHPSKNIVLNNGYTANFAIRELSKIDFSKRFDLNKKDFGNSGDAIQLYTVSHSFVIYDKMNDITKPKSRAIDKDKMLQQLSLFDLIKKENKKLEVLRLEVRLSSKRKMNEQLARVGYPLNPNLRDIFNHDLCKKIVQQYWYEFFSDNQFLFNVVSNPQEILQLILRKHPEIKTIKAINIIGLYCLCRDDEGIRGFRKIIDSYKPKSNWATVKKYIELLDDEIFAHPAWGFIGDIKQQLGQFKPLRTEKLGVKNELPSKE